MIRLYITKFTYETTTYFDIENQTSKDTIHVSNPLYDRFDTFAGLTGLGRRTISCKYAEQDPITRLPKTDIVVCILKGGSIVDDIQLKGVQRLPTGKRDKLISTLSNSAKTKIKNIAQTIDPDVDLSQFVIIKDVIMYIIRSVEPGFANFGNPSYEDESAYE